jgi:hypothetical protein
MEGYLSNLGHESKKKKKDKTRKKKKKKKKCHDVLDLR